MLLHLKILLLCYSYWCENWIWNSISKVRLVAEQNLLSVPWVQTVTATSSFKLNRDLGAPHHIKLPISQAILNIFRELICYNYKHFCAEICNCPPQRVVKVDLMGTIQLARAYFLQAPTNKLLKYIFAIRKALSSIGVDKCRYGHII